MPRYWQPKTKYRLLEPGHTNDSTALNNTDLFWRGIKVFSMTALEVMNYYHASSAPYIRPKVISKYYGGELKYPFWSLPAVENLFVDRPSNESSPSPASVQKGPWASHLKDTI